MRQKDAVSVDRGALVSNARYARTRLRESASPADFSRVLSADRGASPRGLPTHVRRSNSVNGFIWFGKGGAVATNSWPGSSSTRPHWIGKTHKPPLHGTLLQQSALAVQIWPYPAHSALGSPGSAEVPHVPCVEP